MLFHSWKCWVNFVLYELFFFVLFHMKICITLRKVIQKMCGTIF